MLRFVFLGLLLMQTAQAADLLIIIDDVGNNKALGERTVNLPGPLNLAFLPHTPHASKLAVIAHKKGHGIMLHAPMANELGSKLGPGGLYPHMHKQILQETLIDDLNVIPHVQGINNHMGSLLTQKDEHMQWVMEIVKQRGLYFIDSLTSNHSVALKQAKKAGIPTLKRDVFLDNELDTPSLQAQFDNAVSIAKKRGYAVLIGHPYPETIAFLNKAIPTLSAHNIKLQRLDRFFAERLWRTFPAPQGPSRYWLESLHP